MIQSLHVKGFRSLTDAKIELSDRVTMVLGANGAGKSSLANSVLYALAGWCEWTDRKGAGYASLIQHGHAQASIDLAGDMGIVMRTLTGSGARVSVGERTGKDAEAVLTAKLPDRDLLAAMLRSDGFIGLPAKEQQDLLFKLAGGEANADWFAARLTDAERDALKDDLSTRLTGSALADSLYKTAYAMRTEANRAAKEAQAAAAQEATPVPPDAGKRENALASELARAKGELGQRQQQLGEAQGAVRAHETAKRRWESAQGEFDAYKRGLAELGECPTAPSADEIEALDQTRIAADEASRAAYTALQVADEKLRGALATVDKLATLGGKCVAADVDCPLAGEALEHLVSAARSDADAAKAERERLQAAYEAASEAASDAEVSRDDALRLDVVRLRWQDKKQALDERMTRAQADLNAALTEYQNTPAPNPETLQANAHDAQEKVARLECELRDLQRALDAGSARKRQQEQLEKAQARAKLLDDLVKKLSPDGLPAQAMQETVGRVVDAVNEVLGEFSGFYVAAGGEGLAVGLADPSGGDDDTEAIPVRLLSESEQLRVGAAISVAFAKLTGFGFVVVDAADRLDSTNRVKLLKMLIGSGVQSLVLATPLNGKRPSAPGLDVVDLVDGRAQVVQMDKAA